MHHLTHLVVFLSTLHLANTLTFSESSSHLSNATHKSLSNLSTSSLLPTDILQCHQPHSAPPLDEDDCFSALKQLPSHSEQARFHRGSRRDFYKLPLSVSQAHCGIRIDLIDGVIAEDSSWDEVHWGAAALLTQCVESGEGLGGNTFVGNNLLIRVTVQYTDEAAGRSNNNTILSSRTSSSSPLSALVRHCYGPGTGAAPDPDDCMLARNSMSYSSSRGVLHRGSADDGRRLPVRYDHQTCEILIDLVDDVQADRSSWATVAWETKWLIFSCVDQGTHLGGYIILGEQKHIRVTVKHISQAAGGNNNSATILNDLERPIDR